MQYIKIQKLSYIENGINSLTVNALQSNKCQLYEILTFENPEHYLFMYLILFFIRLPQLQCAFPPRFKNNSKVTKSESTCSGKTLKQIELILTHQIAISML